MNRLPRSYFPVESGVGVVPLLTVVLVIATFLFTPLRIIAYGYLPPDDALRHAAKAISGKPWQEILVLRPELTLDPHQGWHQLLGWVHRTVDGDAETLVVFSVVSLFLLFALVPLAFLRQPEAWLLSLLAIALPAIGESGRLFLGRPYLITMTVVAGVETDTS